MKCRYCGADNVDSAKFCRACGKKMVHNKLIFQLCFYVGLIISIIGLVWGITNTNSSDLVRPWILFALGCIIALGSKYKLH